MKVCSIPGCMEEHVAKGYCGMHYMRVRRHEDPHHERAPILPFGQDGLRVCSRCKIPKGPGNFRWSFVDEKYSSWCFDCENDHQVNRYQKDPEFRSRKKTNRIKLKYGLTPEAWTALFEKQGGVCAICGLPEPLNKRLAVDHNHATGKTRGLLCSLCNRGIGMLRDSVATLSAAIDYIKRDGD